MTTTERLTVLEWLAVPPRDADTFDRCIRRLDDWMTNRKLAKPGEVIAVVKSVDDRYDPAVYVGEHRRYWPVVTAGKIPEAWAAVRKFVEERMEVVENTGKGVG